MKYLFDYMVYLISGWIVIIFTCGFAKFFLPPKYYGDIEEFQEQTTQVCWSLVFVIIIFAMVVSLITFGVGVLSG